MYRGNECRLCVEICEDNKSLYDVSDNPSEIHQLMMQYFDQEQMFSGNKFTVICMKCWNHIVDFNNFQESVYRVQRTLQLKDEEIDIKSEEEFLPEDNIAGSGSKEQSNDCNIYQISDSDSMDVLSTGGSYKTDDNLEFDEPVGVFIGGEFDNENDALELPVAAAVDAEEDEALTISDTSVDSVYEDLQNRLAVKASDDLIAQRQPVLKCICCTETCSTFSLLEDHFQRKHPHYQCQVRCCGKIFSGRDSYEDHIRLHYDPYAFVCALCGRAQNCRRTLARHIREQHPASIETTTYPREDAMPQSSQKVAEISTDIHPQNPGEWKLGRKKYIERSDDFIAKMRPILKCYLCPANFTTFSLFRQHFSECHPDNQCYIECCHRKLTARFRIFEHLQLHANPDFFKCESCDVSYTSQYQLRVHLRKHHSTTLFNENKKKYIKYQKSDALLAKWVPSRKCALCKKLFATLSLLQLHFQKCHSLEQFHIVCCNEKFVTRSAIKSHVRHHIEPKGFKCGLCGRHYIQEKSLIKHKRICHYDILIS